MKLRQNKNNGQEFFGCTKYPDCKGILPSERKPDGIEQWIPVLETFGPVTQDDLCGGRYCFMLEEIKCYYFPKYRLLVIENGKARWENNGLEWIKNKLN